MRAPLGDSHNFGRRVELRGGRVLKPRTVFWEWLLLARESPLRRLLSELAENDGLGGDAFDFLPSLRFYGSTARNQGEVERIALDPVSRLAGAERLRLAESVGRALSLFSWLGVTDLHWENLVLGRNGAGHCVFGPLDIEMMFGDLSLPTETKLLPDADPEYRAICQHACGVRRVLPYLGKPVDAKCLLAMAASYRALLALLERRSRRIADVVARVPGLKNAPIRVCLRGTDEYVRAASEPLWPPLLDAESAQLERGDIPYFFRLYGRPGIHYYANRAQSTVGRLPLRGDTPKLDPILQLSRGLRAPSRRSLREQGLFTLFGAFDHPSFSGHYESGGLRAKFGARSITLTLPDGAVLGTKRNLSAFVSSVYQPCRCGEVRSVFVPQKTVCRPRG